MADGAHRVAANGAVRSLPPMTRLSLRIRRVDQPLPSIAGLSLDLPVNRFSSAGKRRAARLGPDEWRIVGAPSDAAPLSLNIAAALADQFHALVDVSHASVAFAVAGPDAEDILNAGCPLDLDMRQLPAGAATRTILGKCEIILFRLEEHDFVVECARSFGEYVEAFLLEAAALNTSTPLQEEFQS